mgnify:CR=1 FL=1
MLITSLILLITRKSCLFLHKYYLFFLVSTFQKYHPSFYLKIVLQEKHNCFQVFFFLILSKNIYKHNKKNLFTGDSFAFYTGINAENSITAPVYTYTAIDSDIMDLTVNAASTSISYLDTKIDDLRSVRSQYAAFSNRIESQIDYIADALLQNTQTLSNIVDTDMALQTSRLVKYQFLEDAALSMYMQTRTQKRDVMRLYFDQSKVEGQGKFYF